jgi:hypothetical protein
VRVQGSSDSPGRNREEDQVSFGLSPRLRTHLDLPFIVVPSARSAPEYMRFFPLQQLKLPRVLSLVPRSRSHASCKHAILLRFLSRPRPSRMPATRSTYLTPPVAMKLRTTSSPLVKVEDTVSPFPMPVARSWLSSELMSCRSSLWDTVKLD